MSLRLAAAVAIALLATACVPQDEPEVQGDVAKAPTETECGWPDPQCYNRVLWAELQAKWKKRSPLSLDGAMGLWEVVAAVERDGQEVAGTWTEVALRAPRFHGSIVRINKNEMVFEPRRDGIASRDIVASQMLYPQCTAPHFDGDIRNSASSMREYIEPWRVFGLRPSEVGRYFIVACTGGPEFPPDPNGHVAEVTVEEANGPSGLYLYEPDMTVIEWGGVTMLLKKIARRDRS